MFAMQIHFTRQLFSRLSFISAAIPTRGEVFRLAFFTWLIPLALALLLTGANLAPGQDWPQVMGTNRDGQALQPTRFDTTWPTQAKIAWQVGLGSGYSGAAIANDKAFALHRLGNEEVLEALDLTNGQKLWRASWPATYRGGADPNRDTGPRCVPTISGQVAVCYGAAGDLVAVAVDSGKLLWHRPLRSQYRADDGYFGAGSAPLVVNETIVVCLGGKEAGVVGIELASGKTKWTATNYDASYAPPIAVDAKTAMVVTRLHTVLIDIAQGEVLSEIQFGSRGPTVNAATPIPVGQDRYLLTANYGVGATLVSTTGHKLVPIFSGSDLLSSQYITPVMVQQRVIAIDGRDDGAASRLCAIDVNSQRVVWEQPNFGTAHLIAVGAQVLALTKSGTLLMIDGAADEYRELSRTQLPPGTYRAPPAISGGRLIARDTNSESGRSQLVCVELPLDQ